MSYSIIKKKQIIEFKYQKNNHCLKYIDFEMIIESTIDKFFKKEKL
jgi:hypothetical protein